MGSRILNFLASIPTRSYCGSILERSRQGAKVPHPKVQYAPVRNAQVSDPDDKHAPCAWNTFGFFW